MARTRTTLRMLCSPAERRAEWAEGVSVFMAKSGPEAAAFEDTLGQQQHERGQAHVENDRAGIENAQPRILDMLRGGGVGGQGLHVRVNVLEPADGGDP